MEEVLNLEGTLSVFTHIKYFYPEDHSFYSSLSISLLRSLSFNRINNKGKKLAENLHKIIITVSETLSDELKNYLKYFKELIDYTQAKECDNDTFYNLQNDYNTIFCLVKAMRAIFKSIVGETDKKESFSDNLDPLGVKLFCERLKITIFLLKNYAETHYFVGKNNSLMMCLSEINCKFGILVPNENLKTGSFPNLYFYNKSTKFIQALLDSLHKNLNKTINFANLSKLTASIQDIQQTNPLILSENLVKIQNYVKCSKNHSEDVYFTLDCKHTHCLFCLILIIKPNFDPTQSLCFCNSFISSNDFQILADQKLNSSNKSTTFLFGCQNCFESYDIFHLKPIKCRNNCKVCLFCRMKNKKNCVKCNIKYDSLNNNALALILKSEFDKKFNFTNFLCMKCLKLKKNVVKFESCPNCIICKECSFNQRLCPVCGFSIPNTVLKCICCEKQIFDKQELLFYEDCGHEIHKGCKKNTKTKSCVICRFNNN